ncbi:VCBS domain-containing protein, partial [Vibrio fluvialis]
MEYDDEGNVLSTTPTTATITITGTNDAPTVAGVSATKTEDDASFTLDLLANSHDEDASDVLKAENITLTGGDASGVSESNGVFTVDPSAYNALASGETETITYSYDVVEYDDEGNVLSTTPTTATITITGTNDAPTVAGVSATKTEDDASFTLDLLANSHDEDASDVLKAENITLTGGDASGVSESNGVFTVDPSAYNALASGETETITYSYDVVEYDDEGNVLSTTPTTATITITGTNDAPTVAGVSATKTEDDASFTLDLLANSHDEDASDVLKAENITLTGGDASGVSESNGVFTVDPSAYNALASGETETITYSYDVVEYDDEGNVLSTTPTTATITITA